MEAPKFRIRIMPQGEELYAAKGQSVLEALAESGIFLRSDCGGKGLCGKCYIRIPDSSQHKSQLPFDAEKKLLGESSLKSGYRLACCLEVHGDLSIEIPEEAFLNPEVVQKPPLSKMLHPDLSYSKQVSGRSSDYGLAVDLGTTTIAVYLCDLANTRVIASVSLKNPQALFGEDVISRINAVARDRSLLRRLQKMVVRAIEWGAASLLKSNQISGEHIRKVTIVGNSTMIHLFLAEDPTSLGVSPYQPRFVEARSVNAEALHFRNFNSVSVLTLPLISGFLGSDIVGAAMAADMKQVQSGTMLIDVGTNGEVMLKANQELL
ncbi:MAG: 2Fe-2S iron-sulfur cluster binding domain-containing protein, partial [Deltaproteobacteria bacterium]|nr:2Fe-2S iron-sulfur cluster binding domain-containing protein [Deltaproteobacteria bacterium]